MDLGAVSVIAASIFVWGVLSGRLERADLTAPLFFIVVGVLGAEVVPVFGFELDEQVVTLVAEVTLAWVLFSDAARVRFRDFRHDLGMYARLLGIGLPVTILLGAGLAWWLLDGIEAWLALLVGVALAPTDASLGAVIMTNPRVPARVRRLINVESGLNDGIVTPVVVVALAGAASAEAVRGVPTVARAILELPAGLAAGVVVGTVGGWLTRSARQRGWLLEEFAGPAVLALALLGYTVAVLTGGNGFVAAFVAGLAFGNIAGRGSTKEVFYVEQTGAMASLVVWLLFGAFLVPLAVGQFGWQVLLYAVLSLTVVRMLPVALALLGSGLRPPTVAFVGWFGPRGLASIIFALLAVEELGAGADRAVAVIALTVLLSVVAHGVSADPLARRYGAAVQERPAEEENRPVPPMPTRGLLRRSPPGTQG